MNARPCLDHYATPLANVMKKYAADIKNNYDEMTIPGIINRISIKRTQAVNFINVRYAKFNEFGERNTIEFRCPNGTLNPVIWQNNVNLLVKLLEACKNENFDKDLIEKRNNEDADKNYNLKWYSEIYLDQALELCDIIFDNNFDKVYFLKQYLKSFQISKNHNSYEMASKFTA